MDHAICVGANAACNLGVRFLFQKEEKKMLSEAQCSFGMLPCAGSWNSSPHSVLGIDGEKLKIL